MWVRKFSRFLGGPQKRHYKIIDNFTLKSSKWNFYALTNLAFPITFFAKLLTSIGVIDGHGVGVWGCAHPPKNLKSPDTPPCRRQGGCAPWCQRPRRKIFHAHPGGSIFSHFLAKSPRCLLNKPPNKKIIWHPCARAAAKIFCPSKATEKFF